MQNDKWAVGLGVAGEPQEWGEIIKEKEYPGGVVIKDEHGREWSWDEKNIKLFPTKGDMEDFVNGIENRPSIPF